MVIGPEFARCGKPATVAMMKQSVRQTLWTAPDFGYTAQPFSPNLPGTSMKPISELLKKHDTPAYHIAPDASVFEALQLLADLGVGALLVMESDQLLGVVSERDYTRKVALLGKNSKEIKVAEIMTRDPFTVTPNTGTRACMSLMSHKKFRHLPVVENGKVMGMISIRDIMDDIIADNEQTISQLTSYISS
jgi:CBS domain-containing protein